MHSMKLVLTLIVLALTPALGVSDESPYAGQETRTIKSLSETEIESLLAGDGMGFAKAAELNGYPGPKHVLELSEELELTPAQVADTNRLYEDMLGAARLLGEELVAAEAALDHGFAAGELDTEALEASLLEIGKLRAKLRHVHLEAHLRQKLLLTADQVSAYDRLRGYHDGGHDHNEHRRGANATGPENRLH